MGRFGIAESGAGTANRVGDAFERGVLADDTLAQALFHRDQLFDFAFEHLRDGNSGPLGDDAGDVFFVDFFFQHAFAALAFHLLGKLGQLLLRLRNQAVTDLCHALVVALAFFGLLFDLELLDLFFEGANARDEIFFLLPVRFERVRFLANLGEFFFNNPQTLPRIRVVFFLERLLFDFELRRAAFELIDVGRQRVDLDAQ